MSSVIEREPQADLQEEIPPFPVRRWTVKEYHDLGKRGVFENENVELLEGWIVPKMVKSPLHEATIMKVQRYFSSRLSPALWIRLQAPITVTRSEPEPDVAIVQGDLDDFTTRHPGKNDVLLAIEVAETSLHRDRRKAAIYAGAGIPVYWIINLGAQAIEVYETPRTRKRAYERQQAYQRGQTIPLKLGEDDMSISVDELLPRI